MKPPIDEAGEYGSPESWTARESRPARETWTARESLRGRPASRSVGILREAKCRRTARVVVRASCPLVQGRPARARNVARASLPVSRHGQDGRATRRGMGGMPRHAIVRACHGLPVRFCCSRRGVGRTMGQSPFPVPHFRNYFPSSVVYSLRRNLDGIALWPIDWQSAEENQQQVVNARRLAQEQHLTVEEGGRG